jgi:hypothetical protein
MANFRPRKRKPLADALTEGQIQLLVEGPNPLADTSTGDAAVIAEFGSVTHFRVIFDAYRDDLFTLAAPNRPWAWWALEGPGMEEPPRNLRIVRRAPSQLKQVPPEMVRSTFLERTK